MNIGSKRYNNPCFKRYNSAVREHSAVSELTIHPTGKFIKAGFILAVLVFLILEITYFASWRGNEYLNWLPFAAPVVLLWPCARWMRRRFAKTVISGDRLRHEVGMTGKSTRTIQLSKLQDVRVDQSMLQRLWNVGNVSLETAGETSRLTLFNVDDPQALADEILNRARGGSATA
jgi:membrane protein YdbS with pleckstrin-like domain